VPLPPWAVRAGARKEIYFNPAEANVAIVTCGGLCPGLNDVVQGLVRKLEDYGVPEGNILGIKCAGRPAARPARPSLGQGRAGGEGGPAGACVRAALHVQVNRILWDAPGSGPGASKKACLPGQRAPCRRPKARGLALVAAGVPAWHMRGTPVCPWAGCAGQCQERVQCAARGSAMPCRPGVQVRLQGLLRPATQAGGADAQGRRGYPAAGRHAPGAGPARGRAPPARALCVHIPVHALCCLLTAA